MTQPVKSTGEVLGDYTKTVAIGAGTATGGAAGLWVAKSMCTLEPMMHINANGEVIPVTRVLDGKKVVVLTTSEGICKAFFTSIGAFAFGAGTAVVANKVYPAAK